MKKITEYLFKWPSYLLHVLILPFFFFDFLTIYHPFEILEYLDMDRGMALFNGAMLACICMLVVAVCRLILHFFGRAMKFDYITYALWCMGEIVIFSGFAAMYVSIMSRGLYPYFLCLEKMLQADYLVLFIPYLILTLSFVVHSYRKGEGNSLPEETSVIKFRDDRNVLKIAVSIKSLMYIEAAENYVQIYYSDNESIKKYTLRSSMKKLESIVIPAGLVRCHRTFFINPSHVRLLGRSQEGYLYAELDNSDATRIPVSRTYFTKLSAML